jgi:hypothetical protein
VYPWAYTPLMLGCAFIGVTAILVLRRRGPPVGALAAGLSAIAIAAALQLVPLSIDTFARLSPAGDAFLRSYEVSYHNARAQEAAEGPASAARQSASHPLSIAPDKTQLGLALLVAFGVFLVGMIRIVSAEGALAFARPLVIFGFVLALIGIGQSALLSNKDGIVEKIYAVWQPRQGGNPFGPFVNRNHFAGWAIMVLPLAISSACAAWEQAKTPGFDFRDRVSWLSTPRGAAMLLVAFAGSVIGLALLMTQSRSGLAAFTTATLMFAWVLVPRQTSRHGKAVAAMLIATLFIGATTWAGLDRIARRLSSQRSDTSTTARLGAWSDTLRIIEAFSVTGSGLNTYGTAMMVYQTGDRRLHFQEAHNDYLQLAAEGGMLIGVPLLLTLAIFARDVRRRFREAPKDGTSYWLRVGAVVGLLAVALQSLVEFSLQMPGNAALFAVVAAIALHRSPNLRPAVEPAAPPGRTPA